MMDIMKINTFLKVVIFKVFQEGRQKEPPGGRLELNRTVVSFAYSLLFSRQEAASSRQEAT